MIVGLTGYAQHGKNTVSDVLVRQYGYTATAFADALREMAEHVNPYVIADPQKPNRYAGVVNARGYETAKTIGDTRRFLQQLGTGVRDIIGPDAWVKAWERKLAALEQTADVTVTDVRFPNEAEAVWASGGEVWGIIRVNENGSPFDNGIGTDHPSEAHIAWLTAKADRRIIAPDVMALEYAVRRIMEGVR